MDDLISRQDAINSVKAFLRNDDWFQEAAASVIRCLPSEQKWIPCSERIPDIIEHGIKWCDVYLVTVNVGDEFFVDTATNWGSYIDDFWDTTNDWIEEKECHVVAWMPLPEPYKEETNGQKT